MFALRTISRSFTFENIIFTIVPGVTGVIGHKKLVSSEHFQWIRFTMC